MTLELRPWAPATDDELTWFRPRSIFPGRPRPLEFTLEVYALTFGLTHALVSLNFPLYEVRAHLFDGELYLGSTPSGLWEQDPEAKMRLLWDSSLRFTRDIRAPWERAIRQEVEGYSAWMSETAAVLDSGADASERLRRLRRVRGMQWYAMMRAVVGPVAMLQRRLAEVAPTSVDRAPLAAVAEDGEAVLREALALVRAQGAALLDSVVARVAQRLVEMGRLATPEEARWLEWPEMRQALAGAGDWRARAMERSATAALAVPGPSPETIGPPLAPEAPRMYLLREVVELLAAA